LVEENKRIHEENRKILKRIMSQSASKEIAIKSHKKDFERHQKIINQKKEFTN